MPTQTMVRVVVVVLMVGLAVAAASIYHFTEQTPREAKEYLGERGIPVRIK